tara:strand:- start:10676 stop:10849 length:174 start_codon:yes stop_codon:yes gene_type:complete
MKQKKLKTDSYGQQVKDGLSFDEYWSNQDRIEDLSYKESIRQRDERLQKIHTTKDTK